MQLLELLILEAEVEAVVVMENPQVMVVQE